MSLRLWAEADTVIGKRSVFQTMTVNSLLNTSEQVQFLAKSKEVLNFVEKLIEEEKKEPQTVKSK